GLAVGAMTTGFEEATQNAHFTAHLFPNPAGERLILNVQNFAASNIKLEITDVFGKILETRRHEFSTAEISNRIDWDIYRLPAGIYFLRIYDRQVSKVLKFVKN
ncbi:MAG TPA: T9SS type A sorting domain-containing protein, partial [Saprospiraceae bacterium]|nr:T9SS type A sorting domain-containing protein [Saprospiraceae bacterium]